MVFRADADFGGDIKAGAADTRIRVFRGVTTTLKVRWAALPVAQFSLGAMRRFRPALVARAFAVSSLADTLPALTLRQLFAELDTGFVAPLVLLCRFSSSRERREDGHACDTAPELLEDVAAGRSTCQGSRHVVQPFAHNAPP